MKNIIITLTLIAAFAAGAFAGPNRTDRDQRAAYSGARRIVTSLDIRSQLPPLMDKIYGQMVEQELITPAFAKELSKEFFKDDVQEEIDQALRDMLVDMYHWSELNHIATWMESPTGQRWLGTEDERNARIQQAMFAVGTKVGERVFARHGIK